MKIPMIVFASFFSSLGVLMAKTYNLSPSGDRWVVSPASFTIHLKLDSLEPQPNCVELFDRLQKNAGTIERCVPGGSQPATACRLLKTTLPKIIFGVDDPSGPLEEDIEQYFTVDKADFEAIPDLASIAAIENLPVSQLSLATQSPSPLGFKQQQVKLVGNSQSYLPNLSQLDYLKGFIGQVFPGTDGSYGFRDRVSYCELVGGQAHLEGQGTYKAQAKSSLSAPALDWTFALYQRLSKLSYPLPGTFEQQALTLGYEIGQFSLENVLESETLPSIIEIYRAFFEKNKDALQIKAFSKSQIQQNFSRTVEADVKTLFQSHN